MCVNKYKCQLIPKLCTCSMRTAAFQKVTHEYSETDGAPSHISQHLISNLHMWALQLSHITLTSSLPFVSKDSADTCSAFTLISSPSVFSNNQLQQDECSGMSQLVTSLGTSLGTTFTCIQRLRQSDTIKILLGSPALPQSHHVHCSDLKVM